MQQHHFRRFPRWANTGQWMQRHQRHCVAAAPVRPSTAVAAAAKISCALIEVTSVSATYKLFHKTHKTLKRRKPRFTTTIAVGPLCGLRILDDAGENSGNLHSNLWAGDVNQGEQSCKTRTQTALGGRESKARRTREHWRSVRSVRSVICLHKSSHLDMSPGHIQSQCRSSRCKRTLSYTCNDLKWDLNRLQHNALWNLMKSQSHNMANSMTNGIPLGLTDFKATNLNGWWNCVKELPTWNTLKQFKTWNIMKQCKTCVWDVGWVQRCVFQGVRSVVQNTGVVPGSQETETTSRGHFSMLTGRRTCQQVHRARRIHSDRQAPSLRPEAVPMRRKAMSVSQSISEFQAWKIRTNPFRVHTGWLGSSGIKEAWNFRVVSCDEWRPVVVA